METRRLLSLMNSTHQNKLRDARRLSLATGKTIVGGVYKRMRDGEQRAEVRFDNVSGCLRTPAGGSSRQTIVVIDGDKLRSRLLSPREAARLMGLSDSYVLPDSYNKAYHLAGDGVAVDVVNFLARYLLEPILSSNQKQAVAAA
jgi:DNA (cytosine-5)-methyltransferase 1